MKFKLLLFAFLISVTAYAQDYSSTNKKAIKNYQKAREFFTYKNDAEAEVYLWKAVEEDNEFIEAWFTLAQIYLDKQEGEKAVEYFLNGLEVDPENYVSGYLKVSDLEYKLGKYYDAAMHLKDWEKFEVKDAESLKKAAALEERLSFALNAIENPVPFNPETLGDAVNTKQFEYWPSLSLDEKTIFFTVLGPQNPDLPPTKLEQQEDFYFARWEEGRWTNRTYLGAPVNTNTNEGAQSVTADGKLIYFTACNRPDGHGRMCDLYYSENNSDGTWSAPKNLGNPVNTSHSEKHPTISADGRILIFASDRPGGKGKLDLWYSVKVNESWTKPVNLGDSINSEGVEQSPFFHPDQKTLYFSSNGWPGMGQSDIFLARIKDDGTWSTPENLGYPINTYNEEIGFIVNASASKAYYSSNRRDETDTDIYSFEIPKELRPNPVSYITGRVFDSRTYKGIEAVFQLIDLNSGQVVMESASNKGEGDYFVALPSGNEYAFNVSQQGYLFYSDHFVLSEDFSQIEPFVKDIPLEPLLPGKSIVLHNIFFDTDSYRLKDASMIELDKVLSFLNMNPGVHVEISGHTDNTGSSAYNMDLSEKRALEVVSFLIEKGVSEDRISAAGYGDTLSVESNDSEQGRAANRRTELKITKVN